MDLDGFDIQGHWMGPVQNLMDMVTFSMCASKTDHDTADTIMHVDIRAGEYCKRWEHRDGVTNSFPD